MTINRWSLKSNFELELRIKILYSVIFFYFFSYLISTKSRIINRLLYSHTTITFSFFKPIILKIRPTFFSIRNSLVFVYKINLNNVIRNMSLQHCGIRTHNHPLNIKEESWLCKRCVLNFFLYPQNYCVMQASTFAFLFSLTIFGVYYLLGSYIRIHNVCKCARLWG